jgi:hypothetical protein
MARILRTIITAFAFMLAITYSAMWYNRCLPISDGQGFALCSEDVLAHAAFFAALFGSLVTVVALVRRVSSVLNAFMLYLVLALYVGALVFVIMGDAGGLFMGVLDAQFLIVLGRFILQITFNWVIDRPNRSAEEK